ncbi:MAG: DUF4192 domain-containing protein [Candidatus Nanopelagicales bacterium]
MNPTRTLRVRGLDDLPLLVPHLVGFHPEESIVVIGLRGEASRVAVTVRIDLPPPDHPLDEVVAQVGVALLGLENAAVDEAILVVYPRPDDLPWSVEPPGPLPHEDLLGEIAAELLERGIGVTDMVCVGLGRQTSYLCRSETCCPPAGREIDTSGATLVEAELVGAGSAPLAGRGSLVEQLAPREEDDPVLRAVRRARPAAYVRVAGAVERTERFVEDVRRCGRSPRDHALAARLVATVGHLLETIPSRDLLLRALSLDPDPELLPLARRVLAEAVRCAGPGDVARPAAALAVCSWVDGDGAAAWVALDRALADDPSYSLAHLVGEALSQGQPPWTWTAIMASLTAEEILAAARPDPGRSPG